LQARRESPTASEAADNIHAARDFARGQKLKMHWFSVGGASVVAVWWAKIKKAWEQDRKKRRANVLMGEVSRGLEEGDYEEALITSR